MPFAEGDRVRIARNGKAKDGARLDNGTLAAVAGFTRDGDAALSRAPSGRKFCGLGPTANHDCRGKKMSSLFDF